MRSIRRSSDFRNPVVYFHFNMFARSSAGIATASGLAAQTTVTHLLSAGDHVVICDDIYGGTAHVETEYEL